ncbi:universal stress protein [Kitasatospora sp. NPDC050543]|uniref:universal stress protein n=1 Tax=Kitasatospora sp. NPDC050543 TaxID=3364054 RepID=UPI0037B83A04
MDRVTPAAPRIAVGVDGSPSSEQALRWAVAQARLTGATVDAVICWLLPTMYGRAPMSVDRELGHVAAKVLEQAVAHAFGEVRPMGLRETAVLGNAAEVLVERSRGAELLVVGSRGHGGFTGALLGSVGQYCVQHASCPVVVIRDRAN